MSTMFDVEDQGCDPLPDACGNELRAQKLIDRQEDAKREPGENFNPGKVFRRERNLIVACFLIVVFMNFDTGRYILYPFQIFSTWVHEMCHGIAALLVGGRILKLQIFKDGSGLAYTATRGGRFRSGFVSSAGYPGTAFTGCLLLLFRRTTLGPTLGTIGMGVCILISCLLWVRNQFALWCLGIEGVVLIVAGWLLPAVWVDNLYSFLAATCCLNAVESIKVLFSANQYVNGQEMESDAHSVADQWGGDYHAWATFWMIQTVVLTAVGVLFARDARQVKKTSSAAQGGSSTVVSGYGYGDNGPSYHAQIM